jgi:uncharacterized membrane protein
MTRALKITGWLLMLLLAFLITLVSLRYFIVRPEVAAAPPLGERFATYLPIFLCHVAGGTLALVLGPWQFWTRLRDRSPRLHRWLGRVYLSAILIGGVSGLYVAVRAFGRLPTKIGFTSLAMLWLVTGVMAYARVRLGDFKAHREWMIRNYALTFAAVTLRLWLPLLMVLGVQFIVAYTIISWLSWVPNLLAVELYLRGMKARRKRAVVVREFAL